MNLIVCIGAYFLDLIVGDPDKFPHPVIYMGKLISTMEKLMRKSKINEKIAGFIIWIVTVALVFFISYTLMFFLSINKIAYVLGALVIVCTSFSTKCLAKEAKKIYLTLQEDDIEKSRKQLSYIVGRDTSQLSREEIIRATVETVAENTVDGTLAPMFYAYIGGPVFAMVYKAVNTMDSMIAYKTEEYKDIGFIAAKMDDLFNFIPARLSLLSFTIGALILGYDYRNCFRITIRDRKNHKSPNCAYPEAAVAGALGIQLGGTNVYFGESIYKPTIGDKKRVLEADDILKANKLLYASTFLSFLQLLLMKEKE